MPKVKMGLQQAHKPEPLYYRRFSNAMIIFIIPGLQTLINGLELAPENFKIWSNILGYIPAVIKGMGVLLGNGQYYASTDPKDQSPPKP